MKRIYLDHAATTPVHPEVAQRMMTYFTEEYGNPSSIHGFGQAARRAVDHAREQVATLIGADPQEIIFTSGGTESDNLAVRGIMEAYAKKGKHIITSKIEHHAVLHTCEHLAKNGYEVTYINVDADGLVDLEQLDLALRSDTVLVTVMHANNEVGTIQPIAEIVRRAHAKGALVHTDAVQTVGHIPLSVRDLGVDLLSLSAHKFHGPKGTGALFVKKGTRLLPIQFGGGHERKLRAGTENVPGIVGLGAASEIATRELLDNLVRMVALRDRLIAEIPQRIPHTKLNGHPTQRLPGSVNFSFEFVEGESLLLTLDLKGIAGSSGSACTSGSLDPSHVLLAMGLSHEIAHGSLRLTLGPQNSDEEISYVLEELPRVLERLRAMSPLFENHKKEGTCLCTAKK